MRCGTSFYNGTLAKQLTLRFWPLAALYTLVLAILLPLQALTVQVMSYAPEAEYYALSDVRMTFYILLPWGVLLCSGIAAMVVCSHLYSTRSANFTAALAPRRTALFATHYLTGLLWLVVPFLVTSGGALAIYLAKLPNFAPQVWEGLGRNMVCVTVALLLFYSLGVLCGMLTGHLLALPVFYLTFNGLVCGVWYLLTLLFQSFYYGYPGTVTDVPGWVVWLTPALRIARSNISEELDVVTFGVYALVGVAMALVAWLLYVKRPMERSGDVVAWAGLRPGFRYGVALCAGLGLGSLTRLILGLGQLGLAVSVLLWGAAGCFAAQMMLTKSVRVLRYWKGAAAIAATFAALFVVMAFDLTGYESRVPQADQVVSVEVSGFLSYPSDPASYFKGAKSSDPHTIQLMTQLHQLMVDDRATESIYNSQVGDQREQMNVTYTLADGTRLSRCYYVSLRQTDLTRTGTATYLAHQMVNRPDLLLSAYQFDQVGKLEREGYRLFSGYAEGISGTYTNAYLSLPSDEARTVYLALLQDIREGNLSRDLFQDEGIAYVTLIWDKPVSNADYQQGRSAPTKTFSPCINQQAVHTLGVLKDLGF